MVFTGIIGPGTVTVSGIGVALWSCTWRKWTS